MAFDFESGSSQYLISASGGAPLETYPLTISAWYNAESFAGGSANVLAQIVTTDGTSRFQLQVGDSGGSFFLQMLSVASGATSSAQASAVSSTGTWQNAIGIVSAADSRAVYLNGANEGTEGTSRTIAALDDVFIGARRTAGPSIGLFFDGLLMEVGIWSAALGAGERAALAAGYSPLVIRPSALVMYLPLVRNIQDRIGGVAFTNTNTALVANHGRVIRPRGTKLGTLQAAQQAGRIFKLAGYGGGLAGPSRGLVAKPRKPHIPFIPPKIENPIHVSR